jgi:hypothetical protein
MEILDNFITLDYYLKYKKPELELDGLIEFCEMHNVNINFISFIRFKANGAIYLITARTKYRSDNGYRVIMIKKFVTDNNYITRSDDFIEYMISYNGYGISISSQYEILDNFIRRYDFESAYRAKQRKLPHNYKTENLDTSKYVIWCNKDFYALPIILPKTIKLYCGIPNIEMIPSSVTTIIYNNQYYYNKLRSSVRFLFQDIYEISDCIIFPNVKNLVLNLYQPITIPSFVTSLKINYYTYCKVKFPQTVTELTLHNHTWSHIHINSIPINLAKLIIKGLFSVNNCILPKSVANLSADLNTLNQFNLLTLRNLKDLTIQCTKSIFDGCSNQNLNTTFENKFNKESIIRIVKNIPKKTLINGVKKKSIIIQHNLFPVNYTKVMKKSRLVYKKPVKNKNVTNYNYYRTRV